MFSRSIDFGSAVASTSPFEIKVCARAQCVIIKPLALHQCTSLHRRERSAQLQPAQQGNHGKCSFNLLKKDETYPCYININTYLNIILI